MDQKTIHDPSEAARAAREAQAARVALFAGLGLRAYWRAWRAGLLAAGLAATAWRVAELLVG